MKVELHPETPGAALFDPQLYRCHQEKRADNYVRVYGFNAEHAQRQASAWLGVEPDAVCVARTEAELLSMRRA